MKTRHAGALKIVLAINAIMFLVELTGGLLARSSSLMADSLDMFGDATVYALSLYAIERGRRWQAGVSLLKGWIMVGLGVAVLTTAAIRYVGGTIPEPPQMGVVGVAALLANLVCVMLLFRIRDDNLNMRSTWICSRNDIIANLAVLAAAGWISLSGQSWPDLIVALGIAGLFLLSAIGIIRASRLERFELKSPTESF